MHIISEERDLVIPSVAGSVWVSASSGPGEGGSVLLGGQEGHHRQLEWVWCSLARGYPARRVRERGRGGRGGEEERGPHNTEVTRGYTHTKHG